MELRPQARKGHICEDTFAYGSYSSKDVYIYSSDMDIQKYTVTMKIIIYTVKISSQIGTISNTEVVDLQ